jgi:hypothetical protein
MVGKRQSMPIASFWHEGLPERCITPIAVTDRAFPAFPGLASGTGFFARREREVVLVTALHCLQSPGSVFDIADVAASLTIPYEFDCETRGEVDFVQFSRATRLAEDASRRSFVDAVALKVHAVAEARYEALLTRCAILPPTGLWLDRFVGTELVESTIAPEQPLAFVVIGYPNHGTSTSVDYPDAESDVLTVNLQSAQFTGDLRLSPLDHCFRLENISWPGSLAGFSGSPVFVQFATPAGTKAALAGMVICGGGRALHFVSVSTLVHAATACLSRLDGRDGMLPPDAG